MDTVPLQPLTHSIPSPPYTLFLHLTIFPSSSTSSPIPQPITLNVTTSESTMPLTAFVYALPPLSSSSSTSPELKKPLCTTIFGGQDSASQDSVEFATRLAKICASKLQRPVYVGASIGQFLSQIEVLGKVVDFVTSNVS
ncbi:hypothetical protein BZA70DRAFT_65578 [Myxozyma melibiosi]|uniref:Uncharacterized protein n=1 Tax=Myxozyma melibiosi TaxID=54550 RepID=A0ABR1F0V3_9ASCO